MPMYDVLPGNWRSYFDEFLSQHEEWPTTILVSGRNPSKNSDMEAQGLPLKDIAADTKDDEDAITITLGRTPQIRHTISNVREVRVVQDDQGKDLGLDIVAKDGTTTTLRFQVAKTRG